MENNTLIDNFQADISRNLKLPKKKKRKRTTMALTIHFDKPYFELK